MDFNRYLLRTDPYLETLGMGIHKAYVEWSSYSYQARNVYSMLSGSDSESGSSDDPDCSSSSKRSSPSRQTGSRSCCHRRSCQEESQLGVDLFAGSNKPNKCGSNHLANSPDNYVTESGHLYEQDSSPDLTSSSELDISEGSSAGSDECEDSGIASQTEWSFINNNCWSDNNNDMPRPPGNQFGSRLGWIRKNNNNNNPDFRCLSSSTPITRTPTTPGSVGDSNKTTLRRKTVSRAVEVFQDCVTNQRYSTSRCTARDLPSQRQSSGNLNNPPGIPSPVLLASFGDAIEEINSDDDVSSDTSADDTDIAQEIPRKISSRKVSFADEQGGSLVVCRVFEPDSDNGSSSDDEFSDSDDDSDGRIMTSEDRMRRVGLFASRTYQRINHDIERVKQLIAQNRDYFESIRPASKNPGDEDTSNKENDEKCVGPKMKYVNSGKDEFVTGSCTGGALLSRRRVPAVTSPDIDPEKADILCDQDCNNVVRLHFAHHQPETDTIHGQIRIRNLCFQKNIYVRYTVDNWASHVDVDAAYSQSHTCPGACADYHETDVFDFAFRVKRSNAKSIPQNSSTLEFAICFHAVDISSRFWDSNSGGNYRLQLS